MFDSRAAARLRRHLSNAIAEEIARETTVVPRLTTPYPAASAEGC
jgi:hypothetical protein